MLLGPIFLVTVCCRVVLCQYDLTNVAPGIRMSANDVLFVSASNAFTNFAVIMYPFRNSSAGGPVLCNMRYDSANRFVHSVAVVGMAKNSTDAEYFMFVFTAEDTLTTTPIACVGTIKKSTCTSTYACVNVGPAGSHQEFFPVGVDTNGTFAYGFTSTFVFKLDIYASKIVMNLTMDDIWFDHGYLPRAVDVADTWAIVVGYGYMRQQTHRIYGVYACLIDLTRLVNASCVSITTELSYLIASSLVTYSELYELSVAIRDQKVLVGVHRLSSVVILSKTGPLLNVSRTHALSFLPSPSVGRVLDWADDTTIAVLVQNPFETSWSTTQIFFYPERSVNATSPLFTFPNHQQILGSRLSRPSFARFGITTGGNMAILTDHADVIIIPLASSGYASQWIETTERAYVFYFEPKLCIGGTHKDRSSLGPCQICPSGSRNPGTSLASARQCMSCSADTTSSFCPLASLADINLTTVPSYSQAVAYPVSDDATDIEDLLIKNVFQMGTDPHCLLVSPLLWTIIVGGLCLMFVTFMLVTNFVGCKSCMNCHQKAKSVFKHTDIIGEGKLWLGGLATIAIVVLVAFAYWFSLAFLKRYPIENVLQPATFACDQTLVNAQFSTGLELLAIPKSPDVQPIFNLLDHQIFNLTVELINTGFTCTSVTAQENLLASKYVRLAIDCQRSIETATTTVTFSLPKHLTTVQINMTGPFWIGGLRLCIRGRGETKASSTLRELDFCEFYSTPNQAIGRYTYIPIVFVKNINMTQALDPGDPTIYTGLWMPTFATEALSDEDYYVEFGDYLRYASSSTILQIELDERPFFIKNIQRPIARAAEMLFHDLLFASLCIELFALSFLLIKLVIIPICRWFGYLWHKIPHHHGKLGRCSKFIDAISQPKSSKKTTPSSNETSLSGDIDEKEQRNYRTLGIELQSNEIFF